MHLLKGKIQHYAWGGTSFIPMLLSVVNPDNQPFAEYWLGTHPGGMGEVILEDNRTVSLSELIQSNPEKYLGKKVIKQFGELPYLLKVLDVKDMLSIQVHPTKAEAEKGFEKENALGIPLNAPNRNYKDKNHKPEVMVALSEFWLLHGFSPNLPHIIESSEWFNALLPVFESRGIEGLYQYVMELPQAGIDSLLKPLAEKIVPQYEAGVLPKSSADFWAGRVLTNNKPDFRNLDRGIFSIYFFNIVQLSKGEGIFQKAGVPHAYMEGQNMELMSNSDNVLRAGLTPKFIDVPELLRHTTFEITYPEIMQGTVNGAVKTFACPVPDFIMHQTNLNSGESFTGIASGPEICMIIEGVAEFRNDGNPLVVKKGDAVFLWADEKYEVTAQENCEWYTAGVPDQTT